MEIRSRQGKILSRKHLEAKSSRIRVMESFQMFDSFYNALFEYSKTRHPDLPPIEVSEPYALVPEEAPAEFRLRWPNDEWPHSKRSGIYVVFSSDGEIMYVRQALLLGRRLAKHFRKGTSGECISPEGYDWGNKRPAYVITAAVPENRPYEMGCLEGFLIWKFPDSLNIRGKAPSILATRVPPFPQ